MRPNDILKMRCLLVKLIDEELRKVGSGDIRDISLEDQKVARQRAIARYKVMQPQHAER